MDLLNNMELFVEVARAKGFRRAAEVLGMPNSTLSRRIAELEKAIGVRLLHRSTRKVELTDAGLAYYRRCEGIVAEARIAHKSLLELAERPAAPCASRCRWIWPSATWPRPSRPLANVIHRSTSNWISRHGGWTC